MEWSISSDNPPCITFPPGASEPVRFAALELRRYLERILSAELPSDEEGRKPSIALETVDDADLTDEGYEIAAEGKRLCVRGGGDAGVVYGAYELLRRYGGCRFSGLGPDGERVPRREQITVDGLPLRRKPRLWYRGTQYASRQDVEQTVQWIDWLAKNGMNYLMYRPTHVPEGRAEAIDPQTGAAYSGKGFNDEWFDLHVRSEMRKRGMKFNMNHHNLRNSWLPPARYFDEHPEWYPLIDGERQAHGGQLSFCTSNDTAVTTVIANIKDYLRRYPETSIIGVIPEDGRGACECDRCLATDAYPIDKEWRWRFDQDDTDDEATPPYFANLAKTERYARLLNQVARALQEEFPEVLVGGASYVDLLWPPEHERLEPNTMTWVAIYWADGTHPISADSPSKVNRAYHRVLRRWQETYPGRLITYEYYCGMGGQVSLPWPVDRLIPRNWEGPYRPLGIGGATVQMGSQIQDVYGLNMTVFARCGWEERVDADQVLDEYLEGMYGAAGPAVRPMYDAFHEAWRRAEEETSVDGELFPESLQWYPCFRGVAMMPDGRSMALLMEVLGEERLDEIIARARGAAVDDRERRQVERLAAAATYWKAAARVFRLERQVAEARVAGDEARAQALIGEVYAGAEAVKTTLDDIPAGWGPPGAKFWEQIPDKVRDDSRWPRGIR